jgi:hypothetical protein
VITEEAVSGASRSGLIVFVVSANDREAGPTQSE